MKLAPRSTLFALALTSLLATPLLAAQDYFQGWDVAGDDAGWLPNTTSCDVNQVNCCGNPGGFLNSYRITNQFPEIGITSELGEVSGDYAAGGIIGVSFDLMTYENITNVRFRVRYFDSTFNGWSIQVAPVLPPDGQWYHYMVMFDPTWSDADAIANGWVQDGSSAMDFATTMSDVYHPEVRVDHGIPPGPVLNGFAGLGVDNFHLIAVNPCDNPTAIMAANFNADAVDANPDLTFPGAPADDYGTVDLASGDIFVRTAVGTLTDQPIEMVQVPGIGSMRFVAHFAPTDCDQFHVGWSGLARSNDIFFMACVIRDASANIVASVEYRPSGQLTYNSVGHFGDVIPVTWTPDVAQRFDIRVDNVAQTTSLSIDGVPVPGFQNVAYGQPAGAPAQLGFEAGGTIAQSFAFDDLLAEVCDCPCQDDTDAPTATITLDRDVLWPPNHKQIEVCADVQPQDNCDASPTVTLLSVTSNEPDNGLGDGDTENDIVIESDTCFLLRSERSGLGDGRKYTITYQVCDESGNCSVDSACVIVPHDQRGHAMAASGFAPSGRELIPYIHNYEIIIPSTQNLDARTINPERVAVGSHLGILYPIAHSYRDVNNDRKMDLVVVFDTDKTLQLIADTDADGVAVYGESIEGADGTSAIQLTKPTTVGLYYEANGGSFIVPDILKLPRRSTGSPEKEGGTGGGQAEVPGDNLNIGAGTLTVASSGRVVVEIFNIQGQKIRTLVDADLSAGEHAAAWDGRTDAGTMAPGGIYFTRMVTQSGTQTRKVVVTGR